MSSVSLPDEVRACCAWVAARARFVRIDPSAIEAYAAGLATHELEEIASPADPEASAAFAICMNAINFGSGWWPTIRKRPGHSGYATMAAGVEERFADVGPWTAAELVAMEADAIAAVVGQDPAHPLIPQFAEALRDVGEHLRAEHDGRYRGVVESADSVPALAEALSPWASFADASEYEGRRVPFFKRAQLAAADLHRAGVADLPGVEQLTAFADNLVPHVLRVDGLLELDPHLIAGSKPESSLSTVHRRRSSCAPALSTRSSFSQRPAVSAPPGSTAPFGTAAATSATSPSPALAPATPPTERLVN